MWKTIFEAIFTIEPNTGNIFIDFFLPFMISPIIQIPVYKFIGGLYKTNIIQGSFIGKFLYPIVFFLFTYILIFICNLIPIVIIILFILFLFLLIIKLINNKRKSKYKNYSYNKPHYHFTNNNHHWKRTYRKW